MAKTPSRINSVVSSRSTDVRFSARLLARKDDVTVQEKEQVLDAVLQTVKSERHSVEGNGVLWWTWAAGLAALLMVVAAGGFWYWGGAQPVTDEDAAFTPKGDMPPTSHFQVHCVNGAGDGMCTPGARLIITVNGVRQPSYFAAFSIRQTDDVVIWMFPSRPNGQSIPIVGDGEMLNQAILLDAHYPAGKYEIVGLISDHPLRRAQIKRFMERLNRTEDTATQLVQQSISISKVKFKVGGR
jgi:hypothetical protein